jgi:ABC-type multidrug transport system ATPase subunit
MLTRGNFPCGRILTGALGPRGRGGVNTGLVPKVESIEVRGVTRVFSGKTVLRGVSTRFDAGTITIIEGPNGAGKSTLLGVLGTTLAPTAGVVVYAPLGEEPEAVRAELGWVAHESRAYRDLTARENVRLSAELRGVDARAAFARLEEPLGLREFADQVFGTLSRGQRQRVALARALVHEPSVILLDEPLTGLDAESCERVAHLFEAERARGAILIVVNHVAGFAERMRARRLRLERGRITEVKHAPLASEG